jgi:hypothetical protein
MILLTYCRQLFSLRLVVVLLIMSVEMMEGLEMKKTLEKLGVPFFLVLLLGMFFGIPQVSAATDYELLWHKTHNFWLSEGVGGIDVASNGDIVVVGHTYFSAFFQRFLIFKTDENGTLKWNQTLNYSHIGYAVKVLSNGDIIAAGYAFGLLSPSHLTISRFDSEGNEKWHSVYYVGSSEVIYGAAIASNGDVIVVGSKYGGSSEGGENGKYLGDGGESPGNDVWALRLNENATVKWEKTFDVNGDDVAHEVSIASNGDLIVVGESGSYYSKDFLVLRLDENGNLIWQNAYNKNSLDVANAVSTASNGDIIVVGQTGESENALEDIWIVRVSSSGTLKWEKQFGGESMDFAYAVRALSNGDIAVAGFTKSFGKPEGDAWILVLDSSGNVKWNYTHDEGYKEVIHSIDIAPNGNLIAAGWSTGDYVDSILLMAIKPPEPEFIPIREREPQENPYLLIARAWTERFLMYHDIFDELYERAVSLGVDNETLETSLGLHNNATSLILDAWRCNTLEEVLRKMKFGIPKLYSIRRALLMELEAIELLKDVITELQPH